MSHSLLGADRATHLKIALIVLVAVVVVVAGVTFALAMTRCPNCGGRFFFSGVYFKFWRSTCAHCDWPSERR